MSEQQRVADDEIDLVELFQAIWQGKWWILVSAILFAAAGVFYALAQPDEYRSDALAAPATDGGSGGLGGNLGGLASMAGVDLGAAEAGMREKTVATLQSRRFLIDFIQRHDLKVPLLASKGWDPETREWVIDPERYDVSEARWVEQEPSYLRAYRALSDQLTVDERDEGLVTLSIESLNPDAAQQWLEWLIQDINDHVKRQEMASTRRNVEYLENQIEQTSIAGMRQVFFSLIEDQTQNLMLAELDEEYAFEVIDPAVVPEEPSGPERKLIVLVALLIGGTLATVGVLVRYAFRQRG